jgi:DNA-binding NtrC family response regulator
MLSLRVLIVDDEKNQRDMLEGFLQRQGYAVSSAASAEEALNLIERHSYEVGLFDMKMSGISGLDLLKRVREVDPELQVIMITAFGTVETAVEAMRAGAFSYLSKPVNLDELLQLVRSAGEKHYLLAENRMLREKLSQFESTEIVGESARIKQVLSEIARVAPTDATVLISGESGTGKELVARTIHQFSSRGGGKFVPVNCAAIPETLLESELMGHEKGAFTGADRRRIGRFEMASGGTIFLDEIGELSPAIQVKLLRLLEEKKFERLGGEEEITADVRVLAATNRDLHAEVDEGGFREDLYYRLNVVNIYLPPLRERREDIIPLAEHFIEQTSSRLNRQIDGITPAVKDLLISHDWPGNVRELANQIERAIVMSRNTTLDVADFSSLRQQGTSTAPLSTPVDMTLRDLEKQHIESVLAANDYSINKTAEILGIHRNTLRQKIKEYGLGKG